MQRQNRRLDALQYARMRRSRRKIQASRALRSSPMTAAPTAGDALALVRLAASGAAGALARHASRIDDINVFPVPDGDTGANLSQTARSVLDALQANSQPEPSAIARVGARAALLGARGNSGIILSQLVRGACDRLGEGGRARRPRGRRCAAPGQHRGGRGAARAGRGHDPHRRARARRRRRGRALAGSDRRRSRRASRPPRPRSRARPTCCRRCAPRASWTPAAPGSSSSCAARLPPCAASRSPRPRRSGSTPTSRRRRLRRAALLHRIPGRGQLPARAARAAARAARRLRRRRLRRRARARARAHRRPRPRALGGHGAGDALGRRDQRHARPARRARRAGGRARRPRSRTTGGSPTCSRSSTETATACSTPASARACC